jgi:membrane protein YdbS with pleckstrin-like domain
MNKSSSIILMIVLLILFVGLILWYFGNLWCSGLRNILWFVFALLLSILIIEQPFRRKKNE